MTIHAAVAGPVAARRPARPSRSALKAAEAAAFGVPMKAVWLVAAAVFMAVSRSHGSFRPLVTLRAPMLVSLLAIVVLLIHAKKWKPADLGTHWIPNGIAIVSAIAVIGFPFGIYPGQSLEFINDAYSRSVLIAVMTFAVARTEIGTRFMARTLVVSGVVASLLAFRSGRRDRDGRLAGANTYDPNDLALVAAICVPLALWWALDPNAKRRWIPVLGLPVMFYVIIETGSRGGFLATAAVVFGLLISSMGPGRSRAQRGIAVGLVAASIMSYPLLPADYRERVVSIFDDQDYNQHSPSGRKEVWKRGIGYAKMYPLTGVGIANFGTAEGHMSDLAKDRAARGRGMKWSAAHNMFVQVTAELGFVAAFFFTLLIVRTILTFLFTSGVRRPGEPVDQLRPMLGIAFMALAVGGFFLSFAYYDVVFVMYGLAAAIFVRERAQRRQAVVDRARARFQGPVAVPAALPAAARAR